MDRRKCPHRSSFHVPSPIQFAAGRAGGRPVGRDGPPPAAASATSDRRRHRPAALADAGDRVRHRSPLARAATRSTPAMQARSGSSSIRCTCRLPRSARTRSGRSGSGPMAERWNRRRPSAADWIGSPGTRRPTATGVPTALHARPDGRCKEGDVCPGGGSEHRVALTGLAVLAFQAGGHYDFNDAEYSECVRHGLDWLAAHQRPDGCLLDREHGTGVCNMYEHGIATFALADACEMAASLRARALSTAIARQRRRPCSSSTMPSTTTAAGATPRIATGRATFPSPAGRSWP